MFETFSTSALEMIDKALRIAKSLGKKLVGTEHLLLVSSRRKHLSFFIRGKKYYI